MSIQRPFFCRLEECEYALATNIRSLVSGGGAAGISLPQPSLKGRGKAKSFPYITRIVFGTTNKERTRCSACMPRALPTRMLGRVAPRAKPVRGSPFLLDYPNIFGTTNKERTRFSACMPRMIILQSIRPLSR